MRYLPIGAAAASFTAPGAAGFGIIVLPGPDLHGHSHPIPPVLDSQAVTGLSTPAITSNTLDIVNTIHSFSYPLYNIIQPHNINPWQRVR